MTSTLAATVSGVVVAGVLLIAAAVGVEEVSKRSVSLLRLSLAVVR